jgi:hypothetical protein
MRGSFFFLPCLLYFLRFFNPLPVVGCRLSGIVVDRQLYLTYVSGSCLVLVVGCRLSNA